MRLQDLSPPRAADPFTSPLDPEHVFAVGNSTIDARYLPLEPFAAMILGRFNAAWLDADKPVDEHLSYKASRTVSWSDRGDSQVAASRTASAQRSIDKFLAKIGLCKVGITASSIAHWRIASALQSDDVEMALMISGRESHARMIQAIGSYRVPSADDLLADGETFSIPA
ncbi:hypothetical protein ASE01_05635 [Nocardioides sp. Root190]|uniref:hypothetical protein n=1 Tax=Nocardioides sp. Root190 TaxID=1736488 RepID=UPI0006F6ED8D|nr:hypothetical protein [Nocardioides sp. Root190]KRB77684.1 hypothetical protein ASE01_05635 [Nocardioides sp. Root190]